MPQALTKCYKCQAVSACTRQIQPQGKKRVKHSCSQSKQYQCKTLKLRLKKKKTAKFQKNHQAHTQTERQGQEDKGRQTINGPAPAWLSPRPVLSCTHSSAQPGQNNLRTLLIYCGYHTADGLIGSEPHRPRSAGCVRESPAR